jgi:fatty acid desaturase
MKPTDDERRRLDEIEAALRESDPRLDRALRTLRPRRPMRMLCLLAGWLLAVGVGVAGWWVAVLILIGPLVALTAMALTGGWRSPPSTAIDGRTYPPTWTRFWG